MTVMDVFGRHIPILQPFLQLPLFADMHWRKSQLRLLPLFAQIGILTRRHEFRGFDARMEQIIQNLSVHRRPGADAYACMVPVLRRDRRTGYKPFMRRLLYKSVQEELSPLPSGSDSSV